jgi:phosphoglycolate phosphatase-like HAD superfamily hydrolase
MKAIIFDIDGTLVESMSVDTAIYFTAINQVLGPVRVRDNLDDYDHVTDSGLLAQLLEDNGHAADSEVAASIKAVFVDGIRDHIRTVGPFPAVDGAVGFLDKTRDADRVGLAIATGGWRESALLKLESAGFDIDGIPLVTGDDAHSRVEIMRRALERLGDDFESVTYFGDAPWDRRACDVLGWEFRAVGAELDGILSYRSLPTHSP